MNTKATATLANGLKVIGRFTTEHPASSYGQPVFVDEDNQAYNWADIVSLDTRTEAYSRAGSSRSEAKSQSARENGKKGGRPRQQKNEKN